MNQEQTDMIAGMRNADGKTLAEVQAAQQAELKAKREAAVQATPLDRTTFVNQQGRNLEDHKAKAAATEAAARHAADKEVDSHLRSKAYQYPPLHVKAREAIEDSVAVNGLRTVIVSIRRAMFRRGDALRDRNLWVARVRADAITALIVGLPGDEAFVNDTIVSAASLSGPAAVLMAAEVALDQLATFSARRDSDAEAAELNAMARSAARLRSQVEVQESLRPATRLPTLAVDPAP